MAIAADLLAWCDRVAAREVARLERDRGHCADILADLIDYGRLGLVEADASYSVLRSAKGTFRQYAERAIRREVRAGWRAFRGAGLGRSELTGQIVSQDENWDS